MIYYFTIFYHVISVFLYKIQYEDENCVCNFFLNEILYIKSYSIIVLWSRTCNVKDLKIIKWVDKIYL